MAKGEDQTVLADDPQNPANQVPDFSKGEAEGSGSETSPSDPPDVGGGDLRGAAQATAAELDAAEKKARTTYVLLLLHEEVYTDENRDTASRANVWEEIARIEAASREAAWEEAKRRCPVVVPEEGGESSAQLVPERFWRKITARLKPPKPSAPELEVDGL